MRFRGPTSAEDGALDLVHDGGSAVRVRQEFYNSLDCVHNVRLPNFFLHQFLKFAHVARVGLTLMKLFSGLKLGFSSVSLPKAEISSDRSSLGVGLMAPPVAALQSLLQVHRDSG